MKAWFVIGVMIVLNIACAKVVPKSAVACAGGVDAGMADGSWEIVGGDIFGDPEEQLQFSTVGNQCTCQGLFEGRTMYLCAWTIAGDALTIGDRGKVDSIYFEGTFKLKDKTLMLTRKNGEKIILERIDDAN